MYKTTNAEYLDGTLRTAQDVDAALSRLNAAASLVSRTGELEDSGDLPAGSANDLTRFMEEQRAPAFEQIVRLGFEKAFELASEAGMPVETFWVTAPDTDFELHICRGQHSVGVFLFVQPQEPRDYGSDRAASSSWVVRAGDRPDVRSDAPRTPIGDDILQIQVSGPYERQGRESSSSGA
ncbi:MAG TPA: hypothetical protein VKD21_17700 [Acidimicrobiales bacterium]|nr:hypothetical protein [Acidimicrobiales bacterium]